MIDGPASGFGLVQVAFPAAIPGHPFALGMDNLNNSSINKSGFGLVYNSK
jgi:hypothetical protein